MTMVVAAPAKLNLGLEVVGRRTDGYHELRSILTSISLADSVEITSEPGLEVTGPFAAGVPTDPASNLASRALAELEALAHHPLRAGIRLTKNIPAGGGFAGGSADAAAVLRYADRLPIGASREDLVAMALALGADVPFQILGGIALVGGVGEEVAPLPPADIWFAVAYGGEAASTAAVFGELRPDEWTTGEVIAATAQRLRAGDEDAAAVVGALPNALLGPATRRYPALAASLERLVSAGWRPRLTGTGAAFFHVCADEPEARSLAASAGAQGFIAWACHSLPAHTW